MHKLLFLLTLFMTSHSAVAMTWGELRDEINNVEESGRSDPAVVARFSEIVQTLVVAANTQAEKNPNSLLYCPPRNQSVNLDQLVSMVRHYTREHDVDNTASVQHLLLQSLISEYPCPAGSG